ncbi:hypothetical protein HMPREF9005_1175 [Actinomyces sp. oral taxon 178 str. F0338]|nr:hypothetical protein HMPREF9005_1175 [Actinomyces sp. oral taxon 178 str. F0338]
MLATGLIPARAGKTSAPRNSPSKTRAHPRACGENTRPPASLLRSPGSSPRVRGKPRIYPGRRARPRLIPARAGKTVVGRGVSRKDGAHPRACGENRTAGLRRQAAAGSSPRVRGKPTQTKGPGGPNGLIPARAGKTHVISPKPF